MPNTTLGRFVGQLAILVLTGMAAGGCDRTLDVTSPPKKAVSDVATVDSAAYYYYQGREIPLRLDPSRIVVGGTFASREELEAAITGAGGAPDSVSALPEAPEQWIVHLGGMTTAQVAVTRARLFADARVNFVGHSYQTLDGNASGVLLNHVIVQFRAGVTRLQVDSMSSSLGLRVQRAPQPDSGLLYYWLAYPANAAADPLAIAQRLYRNPLVSWADPDKISDAHLMSIPNDPYFVDQWHLHNTIVLHGVPVDDDVEAAWDLTLGSSSIKVAVIDDGVDFNQTDINFGAGGMAKDLFFPCSFSDCVPGESAIFPVHNDTHGTAVAGIITGRQNNGEGIAGIAPNVVLNVVRLFRDNYPPFAPGEYAGDGNAANGINWAWQVAKSDVINNSWGGGMPSDAISAAVHSALVSGRNGNGTVVVFAAGNNALNDADEPAPLTWQAQLPGVVAVGAIDRHGLLADYSNSGSGLTLVAPSGHETNACFAGSDLGIVTTDLEGSAGCNDGPGRDVNYTQTFSGTSAAAPQVSAVAALLLSREPSLTAAAVKSRLQVGAVPWGSSTQFGAGKLDAFATLAPLAVNVAGPTLIQSAGVYTWTATATGLNGSYTYQWQESFNSGATWVTVGSNSATYSESETSNATFELRVNVTSGVRQVSSSPLFITVQLSGCGPRGC